MTRQAVPVLPSCECVARKECIAWASGGCCPSGNMLSTTYCLGGWFHSRLKLSASRRMCGVLLDLMQKPQSQDDGDRDVESKARKMRFN